MTDGSKKLFPPPPDIEPIEDLHFAAPILFEMKDGVFVAKLGANEIGTVEPHSGGIKVKAHWSLRIAGVRMAPAPSIPIAAERLAARARDWFAECGFPLPKGGA